MVAIKSWLSGTSLDFPDFEAQLLHNSCTMVEHNWTILAWPPLQSLAVKQNLLCANFGRWKTFRKVPVKYFWAAWEGLKMCWTRFGSIFRFFSRFSNRFSCRVNNCSGAISFCRRAALKLLRNYCATIASLPTTPFTPIPIPDRSLN